MRGTYTFVEVEEEKEEGEEEEGEERKKAAGGVEGEDEKKKKVRQQQQPPQQRRATRNPRARPIGTEFDVVIGQFGLDERDARPPEPGTM